MQRTFECIECKPSKWLKSKESLEKHTKQHHTGEIPVLQCAHQNCLQTCVNSNSLKKHIAWHKDIDKKKEKEREEYLKKQKQQYEDLKRLAKKRSSQKGIQIITCQSSTWGNFYPRYPSL